MNEFKVGDRVKLGDGLLGTVVVVDSHVGVRHDDHKEYLHNLSGMCEDGYGWWYLPTSLTKLNAAFKGSIK